MSTHLPVFRLNGRLARKCFVKSVSSLTFIDAISSLKGEKISPVLINNSNVALLIQLKRPPVILHSYSNDLVDGDQKTRLPGTPLIGRANAWLFQLTGQQVTNNYVQLFQSLRCYNLTPRRFSEYHILRLIHPLEKAKECLHHVRVLSNNKWITDNQQLVDHFLAHRWLRYPFERKFEMMKLLSKHIITVNDLIMDEQLDQMLSQCSLSALIACTGNTIIL